MTLCSVAAFATPPSDGRVAMSLAASSSEMPPQEVQASHAMREPLLTDGWYNVLYLLADDMRPMQPGQKTPNLDRLAATGLTFAHAYAQYAVCGPSRASFMTGRRPHHTKVVFEGRTFRKDGMDGGGLAGKEWTTLPGWFKARGFLTLGGGKTFHQSGGKTNPEYMDGKRSWDNERFPYFPYQQ